MGEFIPEVQAVIDKWRKTISEGGEFFEGEVRREIIRAGGYKLGVGETDRAMRAIKEPFKMEDRIRGIAKEEAREALGVTSEVAKAKEIIGVAYRVDIENIGVPRDATAADVIRFEREELGNTFDVPDKLLSELDKYKHSDVIWVTKTIKDAEVYLSEGMTPKDISKFRLPPGSKIIAEDQQGGFLVLRGGATPKRVLTVAEQAEIAQLRAKLTIEALKKYPAEYEAARLRIMEIESGRPTIP